MRCETFRTDPATLIEGLGDAAMLRQYLAAQEAELAILADRQLTGHIRRLGTLAAQAMTSGITVLAKRDAAHIDALLTDIFAVATWHRWDLPIERLAESEVDIASLPRGLLGADVSTEGAGLWVVDHSTVALARQRQSGDADWDEHHPRGSGASGSCTH